MNVFSRSCRPFGRTCLIAALGLWLAVATARAGDRPDALHLISVGITNAQNTNPLRATKKDALDMAAWASSQEGKLFKRVHARPLTNEQATRHEILSAIGRLKCQVRHNDYVILYMSAHGGKNLNGDYEFVAYDGPINWREISDALNRLPGTKIVILDTCNAGAILRSDKLIVFSACLADELSKDGSTSEGNSLFTEYLREALAGRADMNGNGTISLSEAAAYVSGRLETVSANLPVERRQTSTLWHPENVPGTLPLSQTVANVVVAPVTPAPQAPAVAAPNNAAIRLAGTMWTGRENAGSLRFEFQPDGRATMFDQVNPQPVQGTWAQQGNTVTITFDSYVYTGQLNGDTLAGNARGTNGASWGFRVSAAAPPAPAPNVAVAPVPLPAPGPVPANNAAVRLAGTEWSGRETGAGALRFQLKEGGQAIMFDEVNAQPVQGNWTQQGNAVTITFPTYVYSGQVAGDTMTGNARAENGATWGFRVSNVAPAPAPVAPANVAAAVAVAGTAWTGREDLGALRFEFKQDGTAIMIDDVSAGPVRGTWNQQGTRVRITFSNCVYEGTIAGTTLSGQATMDNQRWNFTVGKQ